MVQNQQTLLNELRRAIERTPDPSEQKALYEKLGQLEVELAQLARQQQEFQSAEAELTQARQTVLAGRVAVGLLFAALLAIVVWFASSVWTAA